MICACCKRRKYQCVCAFDEDSGYCIKEDLHETRKRKRTLWKVTGWEVIFYIMGFITGLII